jgi:hypothetical protein
VSPRWPRSAAAPPRRISQKEIDAWVENWRDERVPALAQLTPRLTARREDKRPHLEVVLPGVRARRYLLQRDGKTAPDIGRLRAALSMELLWAEKPVSR